MARRAAAHNQRGSAGDMTEMTEMNDFEFEHLAFNEALYLPSFGDYVGPGVVKRTLNYLCFANSKTAFRFMRKDKKFGDPREHTPVSVRLSYHPNEAVERADALVRFYARGDTGALAAWRDGEVSGGKKAGEEPGGRKQTPARRAPTRRLCATFRRRRRGRRTRTRSGGTSGSTGAGPGGRDTLTFGPRGGAVHALGGRAWGFIPTNARQKSARTESANEDTTSNADTSNVVAIDGRAVYARIRSSRGSWARSTC